MKKLVGLLSLVLVLTGCGVNQSQSNLPIDAILGWHAHLYKFVSLTSAGSVGKKLGEVAYHGWISNAFTIFELRGNNSSKAIVFESSNGQFYKAIAMNSVPHDGSNFQPQSNIGSATSNTPSRQVADMIQKKYGEIRNEYRVGNTWILTTLGNQHSRGVIGLYSCSPTDSACINGEKPLSFVGWNFYKPSFPGGVTLLQIIGHTLIIDNGGHQITFNLSTRSFGS